MTTSAQGEEAPAQRLALLLKANFSRLWLPLRPSLLLMFWRCVSTVRTAQPSDLLAGFVLRDQPEDAAFGRREAIQPRFLATQGFGLCAPTQEQTGQGGAEEGPADGRAHV